MESKNHKEQLLEIHDLIKGYAQGTISREKAQKEYEVYDKKLFELNKKSLKTSGINHIKDILMWHNLHNFSKITALFSLRNNSLELITFSGEQKNIEPLKVIIESNRNKKNKEECLRVLINKNEFIELYLYLIYYSIKENEYCILTLSSSPYYSEKRFIFIKTLLKQIYQASNNYTNPLYIDFINENSNKLSDYLKKDRESNRIAHIYIFHNLESIFGHLGLYRIREVTDFIMDVISQKYEKSSEIIQFSFKTYICIFHADDEKNSGKKKIDFLFDGITIPFKQKVINLHDDTTLLSFLDEIYSFENQSISG